MEEFEETREIHIHLLHPHDPAASFTYPVQLDKLTIPVNLILSLPTPASETGRTYKLTLAKAVMHCSC
jgi:hypothetical protein